MYVLLPLLPIIIVPSDSNLQLPEDEPLDQTIFEDGELQETFSAVDIFFRVINVEQDPDHPTRPKINYVGEMDGNFSIVGYVKLTPDDQIRWHFVSFTSRVNLLLLTLRWGTGRW